VNEEELVQGSVVGNELVNLWGDEGAKEMRERTAVGNLLCSTPTISDLG
jgi:hypothetical protein